MRLTGKIALITGGASGLGAEQARLFVAEGACVYVVDIDETKGAEVARELGADASFRCLDVRNETGWRDLIAEIAAEHGRLDVLVNGAGVVRFGTPESVTMDDYRFIMETSVDGMVLSCKYALPIMKAGGSIINMSSIASLQGEPYVAAYCAAKGAVEAYTRSVAVYCAQNRIPVRCNSIHPAAIDTPMTRNAGSLAEAAGMTALLENDRASLSNPVGTPQDVGYLVLYLASDESRFISGQRFVVDNTASVTAGQVPGGGSVADL